MRCTVGVLLVSRLFAAADLCCATIKESVYDTTCVKQVMNGAEMAVEFCLGLRILQGNLEVCPLRRYE